MWQSNRGDLIRLPLSKYRLNRPSSLTSPSMVTVTLTFWPPNFREFIGWRYNVHPFSHPLGEAVRQVAPLRALGLPAMYSMGTPRGSGICIAPAFTKRGVPSAARTSNWPLARGEP